MHSRRNNLRCRRQRSWPRGRQVDQLQHNGPVRDGAATLDYILLLGVILPLVAFVMPTGKRIIQLTYEMICTLIAWPFL